MPTPTCTTCQLCLRQDHGYSNVTVEGTTLHCLEGLNPGLEGQEAPWREVTPEFVALLDVARTCPQYAPGTPAWLDVDREEMVGEEHWCGPYVGAHVYNYADTDRARELLAEYLNGGTR